MLHVTSRIGSPKKATKPATKTTARKLAEELGYLPLALEQATAFIIALRWSFEKYRERLRKLLGRIGRGRRVTPLQWQKPGTLRSKS